MLGGRRGARPAARGRAAAAGPHAHRAGDRAGLPDQQPDAQRLPAGPAAALRSPRTGRDHVLRRRLRRRRDHPGQAGVRAVVDRLGTARAERLAHRPRHLHGTARRALLGATRTAARADQLRRRLLDRAHRAVGSNPAGQPRSRPLSRRRGARPLRSRVPAGADAGEPVRPGRERGAVPGDGRRAGRAGHAAARLPARRGVPRLPGDPVLGAGGGQLQAVGAGPAGQAVAAAARRLRRHHLRPAVPHEQQARGLADEGAGRGVPARLAQHRVRGDGARRRAHRAALGPARRRGRRAGRARPELPADEPPVPRTRRDDVARVRRRARRCVDPGRRRGSGRPRRRTGAGTDVGRLGRPPARRVGTGHRRDAARDPRRMADAAAATRRRPRRHRPLDDVRPPGPDRRAAARPRLRAAARPSPHSCTGRPEPRPKPAARHAART